MILPPLRQPNDSTPYHLLPFEPFDLDPGRKKTIKAPIKVEPLITIVLQSGSNPYTWH